MASFSHVFMAAINVPFAPDSGVVENAKATGCATAAFVNAKTHRRVSVIQQIQAPYCYSLNSY